MNGRLYDPVLHRFLQPDNYVQDPFNTQNFNRYGYVLNNPLIYTDPSGDIFEWIFAIGNLMARASRGSINNFGDGLEAFFQGFLAGLMVGPNMLTATSPFNSYEILSGLGKGIFQKDWTRLKNSSKLFWGNFYLDENRTFFGGIWQGISRFTWENPQTSVGNKYSQSINAISTVDRVDYLGGATFATNENSSKEQGVSLGNFININIRGQIEGDFTDYVLANPLYMHEYGHYIDSQALGLSYLFVVGTPSFISAWQSSSEEHSRRVYEMRANRKAARYFGRYYDVDWTRFEDRNYPRN